MLHNRQCHLHLNFVTADTKRVCDWGCSRSEAIVFSSQYVFTSSIYLDAVYSKAPFGQHDCGAGFESAECVSVLEGYYFEFREKNEDLVVPLRCADPSLYTASP